MKKILLLSAVLTALAASAQTAREEIEADVLKSASNHMAYQAPATPLTKAPKGYEPFYISHYGRHGSRWLLSDGDYMNPIRTLRRAREQGVLTPLGQEALEKLERFYPSTRNRLGDLSDIGEQQHHGIGKRMTEHFPEVFAGKNAQVDARSTVVIRCILSMTAECEEITAFNPNLQMHNDVSEAFQWYLNADWSRRLKDASRDRGRIVEGFRKQYTHPERLCRSLFSDERFWDDEDFRPRSFMRSLFYMINNMQSHSFGENLWNLFTTEECYDLWRITNIDWYLGYGPAPQSGGVMPFSQANLLRNMIETTDTVLASKTFQNGATLRFGHEVCVMPLACLMELDSCGVQVDDLNQLDSRWVNFRIYPMACNIQCVYYRPKNGRGDILVKVLLNEKETRLPIQTEQYPYYKWDDLRAYYLKKLDDFDKGK